MQSLEYFNTQPFIIALKAFFKELNIPINYIADEPAEPGVILGNIFKKENVVHQLINEVYALGMVNDAVFEGTDTFQSVEQVRDLKTDYDGLLIFGVTLHPRSEGLPITRSQLAEITRAFNRAFPYTPVTIVFKYNQYISFANSERIPYKQSYREGEKVGKVSLLRDIDILSPHRGHKDILNDLKIQSSGKNGVNSFASLYKYWQEVFSVSILNKRFYKELQNWYFWAIKEVTFPNSPNRFDYESDEKFDEAVKEHKGKNVIRLLTRILFIWFIKEKGLIPEQLFDEKVIAEKLIKDFTPQKPQGIFATGKNNSTYYRAILQNLFFATLNQEMGKRSFRSDGQHQNVTNLMRYKSYFKDPDYFVQLMEEVVPFMNGGLFECLDKPHPTLKGKQGGDVIIYNDGFSDRDDNLLVIPDYLFFDVDEVVDLSDDLGNKVFKNSNTRGLIEILESYKFTITENTPIEEDVALDPELLGKVFENLLASYNPETKTTARKQTGSFYTPREIVSYMVDESLIAYLKTNVKEWNLEEEELDKQLHQLISYDTFNPFEGQENVTKEIIHALDKCKILDPACGSGAFPMGALQKMVHVLQKLDPENRIWKEIQLKKVQEETNEVFLNIENKAEREDKLKEINNAFDQKINDPDYARKLYLIENCIYGVDIQPIAIQISKLRFFISLVVDQKNNQNPNENFGIRPLPNLETKFVAANTLIDIEKPKAQLNLFENQEVKKLEDDLKKVRHKLFSSKSPANKRKLREEDKELRNRISEILVNEGWDNNSARQLASWDPYDQNSSSSFFNPEWMFDIADGFDVVIGNPPYIKEYTDRIAFESIKGKKYYQGKMDIWYYFACIGIDLLRENGNICFIATNNWTTNAGASILRNKILNETKLEKFIDFSSYMIFESAAIQTMIFVIRKCITDNYLLDYRKIEKSAANLTDVNKILNKEKGNYLYEYIDFKKDKWLNKNLSFENTDNEFILEQIKSKSNFSLDSRKEVAQGIVSPQDFLNKANQNFLGSSYVIGEGIFNLTTDELMNFDFDKNELELIKPFYSTSELGKYFGNHDNHLWIIYTTSDFKDEHRILPYPNIKKHLDRFKSIITSDNKPYGLHRSRNENFFKGEKIISLRKCASPTFTYTDFDCYVSQTFFIIKSCRINLKYLTGILNSKLVAFWLWHRGKLQGDFYQIDKEPLLEIPLIKDESKYNLFNCLVDFIIFSISKQIDSLIIEQILDSLVFNLYFPEHMQEREIDVMQFVERDVEEVMQGREFDSLSTEEKENVIEKLHQTWSNPDNEVLKRINLFKEKSPDILKPILEC